jgi:hypothetical protein
MSHTISHEVSVAAILSSHIEVSNAIRELQRSGCDLNRISVVGKDVHVEGRAVGYYNTGHRLNYWGSLGAFWGGLWGLLNGSAFFVIPGIGQVLVAGPLVQSIVNGMEEEVEIPPQNALSAGFHHSKIHKDRLGLYETAIRGSKFVIFAHGPSFETADVGAVLTRMGHDVHATTLVKEPYAVKEPFIATDPYAAEAPSRVFVIEVP